MYPPILRIHSNKDQWISYQMMLMRCCFFCCFFFFFFFFFFFLFFLFFSDFLYKSICCGYSFELHRQVDAIQMGTHNICLFKEVDKNCTGCNLDWLLSFLHFFFFSSFFITYCSCICPFNPISLFYYRFFPLRDITYQIIIRCTRLYTFEKKRENDRKDRVWRQTSCNLKTTELLDCALIDVR